MEIMLKTINLSKETEQHLILDDINISVKKGEIYGLLGPNGAGKTTLLKAICNLVSTTSGSINIFGEEVTAKSYAYLRRIGAIIEQPTFEENLSGLENLKLHCEYLGYYKSKSIEEAMELTGVTDYKEKLVSTYSTGMRQRLGIARAILAKPELLILDEPINGLDPAGIKEMRDMFGMLCRDYGMTIIISSHILGELELLCDTIGILKKGKLQSQEPISAIKEKHTKFLLLEVGDAQHASAVLSAKVGIDDFKIDKNGLIRIYDDSCIQSKLIQILVQEKVEVISFQSKASTLEDYYLAETKEENRYE